MDDILFDEIYSEPCDCLELNRKLIRGLNNRISIYGSLSNPLINGKYYGAAPQTYSGGYETIKKGMQFFAKFNKEGFLRIEVGNSLTREVSDGEKLAALSDICSVLAKDYGTPDAFYTTKDDDEERLSLQWTFKDLELNHERMDFNMYFDDAEIEKLIFMDNTKTIGDDEISSKIGLPSEMYDLVKENIDEFVAHKNGANRKEILDLVKTKKLTK